MRPLVPALAVALLTAGCSLAPAPRPAPAPVVHRTTPPDWFQQQMAAARAARAAHTPRGDTEGAQAAYDGIVQAACARVAISGPPQYQARCAAALRPTRAPEPLPCDPAATDPTALQACND